MQEIVDKYKDDTSEYLLPILRYCDINDRKQYKLRAKQIGRGLNKIGLRLELKAPLTFYVARHSWASIAQDRKVSTDIIREGLGHDNEKDHSYLSGIHLHFTDRPSQSDHFKGVVNFICISGYFVRKKNIISTLLAKQRCKNIMLIWLYN